MCCIPVFMSVIVVPAVAMPDMQSAVYLARTCAEFGSAPPFTSGRLSPVVVHDGASACNEAAAIDEEVGAIDAIDMCGGCGC